MTDQDSVHRRSLVDEALDDPTMALDMAAATGVVEGSALLARVFSARGMSQGELAERVSVSEERVAQLLEGEENLRLSTVSRYLFAMGYRLELSATEITTGAVVESRPRMRPKRRRESSGARHSRGVSWNPEQGIFAIVHPVTYMDDSGTGEALAVTVSSVDPRTLVDRDGRTYQDRSMPAFLYRPDQQAVSA